MYSLLFNNIKTGFLFLLVILTHSLFAQKQNSRYQSESLLSVQYLTGNKDNQNLSIEELPGTSFTEYKDKKLKPNTWYWVKLVFDSSKLDQETYFIHFNDFFAQIISVQFLSGSSSIKNLGGSKVPLKDRTHKGFFKDKVLLKKSEKGQTEIYLKVIRGGHSTYEFPHVDVIAEREYQSLKIRTDNTQSFFAGMIAILCLFNLVLFLLTRQKIYLFYFVYAIVGSLYFFFYYDYIELFIFPGNPHHNRIFFFSNTLSQSLYFFFLFFVVRSQEIGKKRTLLFRYAIVITSITAGSILYSLLDFGNAVTITDIMSVINGLVILLLFGRLIRKVSITSKIILVGSLFLALGGSSAIIANFFRLSIAHIFIYQVGFCIELILFTLAINFTHYSERLERIRKQLELARLQTEKLEKEKELEELNKAIDRKNRDLTYKAFIISQKEFIQKDVMKKLSTLNNEGEVEKGKLNQVIANLKSSLNNNHWNEFESHFTLVHPHFYNSLNEKYPNLTASEYKLCAFLKMNLCSKEIAQITGKSQQSVDVA